MNMYDGVWFVVLCGLCNPTFLNAFVINTTPSRTRTRSTNINSKSISQLYIRNKSHNEQRWKRSIHNVLHGWAQDESGEWEWVEDDLEFLSQSSPGDTVQDPSQDGVAVDAMTALKATTATATPSLPAGSFRPKQSLGQNFLRDGNTVAKIINSFVSDTKREIVFQDSGSDDNIRAVELGPGAGALTDTLVTTFADSSFQCIEIDPRSVELLHEKHPSLRVRHMDVLQVDYPEMAQEEGGPLSIIGNLPYYITSQILFALADASHFNAIKSATVTMQYEVAQRIVAKTRTKDYGILSVVFQLYANCHLHYKIPPTVFYPQPKVDSALIGLHFIGADQLRTRLGCVQPIELRKVLTATFQQRRKTIRNSLKKLVLEQVVGSKNKDLAKAILDSDPLPLRQETLDLREKGDVFASTQELPLDWGRMRPEELSSGQFVELTRLIFHGKKSVNIETHSTSLEIEDEKKILGRKVWRKMKHGN